MRTFYTYMDILNDDLDFNFHSIALELKSKYKRSESCTFYKHIRYDCINISTYMCSYNGLKYELPPFDLILYDFRKNIDYVVFYYENGYWIIKRNKYLTIVDDIYNIKNMYELYGYSLNLDDHEDKIVCLSNKSNYSIALENINIYSADDFILTVNKLLHGVCNIKHMSL